MNPAQMLLQLDLLLSRNGTRFSDQLQQNRITRSNTPSGATDHILDLCPSKAEADAKLWIVDRILEPQTVPHFIEACIWGKLATDKPSSLPPLDEEVVMLMQQPFKEWAPPPFDASDDLLVTQVMIRIGSFEDPDRLVSISKELHAMKSRIWEGIMPISERRWQDLRLDDPDNFHEACQYIASVTNVFHYFNLPPIKAALRQTYNLIWDHLDNFEKALNAKHAAEGKEPVSVTSRWHEYISNHFEHISNHAHRWVISHIERLRESILEELANHENSPSYKPFPAADDRQWDLTNKIHDLVENAAQADTAMFIPMDGYKGAELPSQDDTPGPDMSNPYRKEPISFSANTDLRKADYYCRLKYLSRVETWTERSDGQIPLGGREGLADSSRSQIRAQNQARAELRGTVADGVVEEELWVTSAQRILSIPDHDWRWAYVGYRVSHDHTDEEWEAFTAKFEADISNWGSTLKGIDKIKELSKVEWRDARALGLPDGDVAAAKKYANSASSHLRHSTYSRLTSTRHFQSLLGADAVKDAHTDIVLVADKAVIDSYLAPAPDQGGFVLAVDVDFDPEDKDEQRDAESPGYEGTLRILGSLLWDDVGAMLQLQTQHLADLWPLAMNDGRLVYQGPLYRGRGE
ncbi:BUD22 domain-containing protein [Purpureocillium lavendulum]|uniref:BUD22 domain-containing protein n=1 Tax=Purpureocillium lavendulum TaxID=1247861 RepID=A0AB34FP71_9HYPO|nr:BUD22 domain-containing protein [Purpureocillium lavendulum]